MHSRIFWAAAVAAVFISVPAFGESVIGRNANATGPFAEGFYSGIAHYQDNEPDCDRNSLLPSNIVCLVNGYNGADDLIGDAWPKILESQDNGRTWVSRFASGSPADPATDLGLGFGADPVMVCWPGGCGGFFIASSRNAEGTGDGGGVYMEVMPELNFENGFRHFSLASGPRAVQLGTGDNFLDKITATFLPDTRNPGTVSISETVDLGNGITQLIQREWPKGRLIVAYASINSSSQNIRIFSTYSDDFGLTWSPPKQVAQTTGVDTGIAVAALGDTVLYAYRQFADTSGDQLNSVFAATSTNRGEKIGKVFPVVENLCPFDQPTLPNAETPGIVTSRTNNFVDVSSDGDNFVMVLTSRARNPLDQSCFTPPFDYAAGSRVLVTTSGASGRNWTAPIEIAPRDGGDGPANGHSFQFMPAVDCVLGVCQAIWYDTLFDSIRNIGYMSARGWNDAVDAFVAFPFFGDFIHQVASTGQYIQVRRTAEVFTRQFTVNGTVVSFEDPEPVRVTRFQLARLPDDSIVEVEQLPFTVRQYKANTASFMGDYVGLAGQHLRPVLGTNPGEPTVYEPNNGPNPAFPFLKPNWIAFWTDTRNVRGQLYANNVGDNVGDALPFQRSPGGMSSAALEKSDQTNDAPVPVANEDQELGAEGVEDSNPGALVCQAPLDPPGAAGDSLPLTLNQNRIKDADIYTAIISSPATAWVLNSSKGLGRLVPDPLNPGEFILLPRTFTIVARNEQESAGRTFRFRIMNQPEGFDTDEARASWEQLPFKDFDNVATPPVTEVDETVGPESSVSVALFVVSALPVNPVTVNVYEVDAADNEALVETLTVNGAVEAGDLFTPSGVPIDVNIQEVHNPIVFAPTEHEDVDYSNPDVWNPDVWNPDVWNPDVWNPDVWNPDVWNPDVWNPDVWNPDVWNPDVWNPDVWNATLTSSDDLDNPEIPSPDLSNLQDADGNLREANQPVARFDVQFAALNGGNTTTPYTADFAVNSPVIRNLLITNQVTAQLIVSQDAEQTSYQACTPDDTGENRILAVANQVDLLTLKIPDIFNNRFGSVTYYSEALGKVYLTIRFAGFEPAIRLLAPEVSAGGISYVVTSQAANTGQFSLDVGIEQAIENNIPPTLTVNAATFPVPLSAEVLGGVVGATLPPDLITARDGEFGPLLPVSCDSASFPAGQGPILLGGFAPLGLGESELTCAATGENAVGTVNFGVIVVDDEPPVLSAMPADFSVERDAPGGGTVTYATPAATDNIDTDPAVACTIPDGSAGTTLFPSGSTAPFAPPGPTMTTVSCVATDAGGLQSATGTFVVTVEDTTAPIIAGVADILVGATSAAGAVVNFAVPAATDIGSVTVGCDAISGSVFPIGSTTVTCTATDDANLTSMTSFLVSVADTIAPVLTLPGDITAIVDSAAGAIVDYEVTATDSSDADPSIQCSPASGSLFPPGTTTVSCTATDSSGNTSSGEFDVTVEYAIGGGLRSNKTTVKAGSVIDFDWEWLDASGNPVNVGDGNQDIEARLSPDGTCPSSEPDVLNEDPGNSRIRVAAGGSYTFNWQTVVDDVSKEPVPIGFYCVAVILMPTDQVQSTRVRVRE